jgi:hypothetical protein
MRQTGIGKAAHLGDRLELVNGFLGSGASLTPASRMTFGFLDRRGDVRERPRFSRPC